MGLWANNRLLARQRGERIEIIAVGTIMNAPKPSAHGPQPLWRQNALQSARTTPANIATVQNRMVEGYNFSSRADYRLLGSLTDFRLLAVRFMELHKKHRPGWEGETEVRQVFGPEDFPRQ